MERYGSLEQASGFHYLFNNYALQGFIEDRTNDGVRVGPVTFQSMQTSAVEAIILKQERLREEQERRIMQMKRDIEEDRARLEMTSQDCAPGTDLITVNL